MITMPTLPFDRDELAPCLSKEVIHYHYDHHTKDYYDNVNKLIENTIFEKYNDLKRLITNDLIKSNTKLYFNACQAFNHSFYWEALTSPNKDNSPAGDLLHKINQQFTSVEKFKAAVATEATNGVGSFWVWLVLHQGALKLKTMPNAGCPLTNSDQLPLLAIDFFEHAYYLQYPADKQAYLTSFWDIIDWKIVSNRLDSTK